MSNNPKKDLIKQKKKVHNSTLTQSLSQLPKSYVLCGLICQSACNAVRNLSVPKIIR